MTDAKLLNAIIYCRVAAISQIQDVGITQEVRCREFALIRGYPVARIFRDMGVSGLLVERPAMGEMLAYLHEHGPCVVLVTDLNRIARSAVALNKLVLAITAVGGTVSSRDAVFGGSSLQIS